MEILGIILLCVLAFIILGIGGWILKIVEYIFDFLFEGITNSLGCLFWILIIVILILGLC